MVPSVIPAPFNDVVAVTAADAANVKTDADAGVDVDANANADADDNIERKLAISAARQLAPSRSPDRKASPISVFFSSISLWTSAAVRIFAINAIVEGAAVTMVAEMADT